MSDIFITGSSGFIGFHLAKALLDKGVTVVGLDNENDYYDVSLKGARREILEDYDNFIFYSGDICNKGLLNQIFNDNNITKVCNLAAQAGVRYSLENPRSYIESNINGFFNVIEVAKKHKVKNFVYASSSSIYGGNNEKPFSIEQKTDKPVSLYAATKKSNELIAHTYSHLYGLPTVGLRFFTVYGPYGRPDMACMIFANKIVEGHIIDVFNFGKCKRDFTYIDDIVVGIEKSLNLNGHQYEVLNLGNNNPVELEYFITLIEKGLKKKANKNYMPLQPGDVIETYADIEYTRQLLGWKPSTSIEEGIKKFISWFEEYEKN